MYRTHAHGKHTFTLIEMLVVVVIIGILAGVLVPRLVGAKERASDSARIVKVGQISSAVELYAQESGSPYPIAPLTGAPGISVATPLVADKIAPYLSTIPTDPGKGTVAISTAPGGIQVTGDSFAYWTDTGGKVYAITALMESKKGNTTNAVGMIDSDKQGSYQVVGKGLTIALPVYCGPLAIGPVDVSNRNCEQELTDNDLNELNELNALKMYNLGGRFSTGTKEAWCNDGFWIIWDNKGLTTLPAAISKLDNPNITHIYLRNNNLTSLPDLSKLINVTQISLNNSNFNSLPDPTYFPPGLNGLYLGKTLVPNYCNRNGNSINVGREPG